MKFRSILVLTLILTTGLAAQRDRALSVSARGVAKAEPTRLVINVDVSATDDVPPEALKKFEAKMKLLEKTAAGLEVKEVKVLRGSTRFSTKRSNNQGFMVMEAGGGEAAAKNPGYEVSEKVRLQIPGLDQMDAAKRLATTATVLDTLSQANFMPRVSNPYEEQMGFAAVRVAGGAFITSEGNLAAQSSNELVVFEPASVAGLETEALKNAVADAKRRATMLAELNGVKIGKVLRVSTNSDSGAWSHSAKECSVSIDISIDFEIVD